MDAKEMMEARGGGVSGGVGVLNLDVARIPGPTFGENPDSNKTRQKSGKVAGRGNNEHKLWLPLK